MVGAHRQRLGGEELRRGAATRSTTSPSSPPTTPRRPGSSTATRSAIDHARRRAGRAGDGGPAPGRHRRRLGGRPDPVRSSTGCAPDRRGCRFGTAGIPGVIEAALGDRVGHVHDGARGRRHRRRSTPSAQRRRRGRGPSNEFVASQGMFTAAEFALIARRHMHVYGTTAEQIAHVAAIIRNNGHVQPRRHLPRPRAVHRRRHPGVADGRRPVPPARVRHDVGGRRRALILTTAERARDLDRHAGVPARRRLRLVSGPSYQHPPAFDLAGPRGTRYANGWAGRRGRPRRRSP